MFSMPENLNVLIFMRFGGVEIFMKFPPLEFLLKIVFFLITRNV